MGMIVTEGMIMGGDTTRATTMIKVEAVGTIADTMIAGMIVITAEIVMIGMTDSLSVRGGL
ncbi:MULTISPECIES: hypothetical protein [unclassified Pseudomonas]|uniref:hypothetical protein n=1 Tax=unclassified Pseudomonas TaxID=196821 RepID=UPI0032048C93